MSPTRGLIALFSAALLVGAGLPPLNAAPAANPPAVAPPLYRPVEPVSPATEAGDRYGASVALDVDTLVVGMPGEDAWGDSAGTAHVFKRNLYEGAGFDIVFGLVATLMTSDPAAGDTFGASVAVAGDTAVVGAYGKDNNAGAAYVFARNQDGEDAWGQVARLAPAGVVAGDFFGASVAMDGDTTVVGAYGKASNAGAAFVFARNEGESDKWGQVIELAASDAAPDDAFGVAVDMDGDTLAVGAPYKGSNAGAVYVFARNQGGADKWGQVARLTAADAAAGDYFGASVAMDGDTLVVGAPHKGSDPGAAYVFARNQGGADKWGQVARLTAFDAAAGDEFGASVAISGSRLVVGTPGSANAAGAAYVFARNRGAMGPAADAWGQTARLTAFAAEDDSSGVQPGARFGQSLAMDGDLLIAGAPDEDAQAIDSGLVYAFAAGGAWQEVASPRASDATANDYFGSAAAMDGDTLIVGAYGKDNNAGAAYVFTRNHNGADAWGQAARLVAPGGAVGDFFADSVALDGDTAVVGAFGKASNTGAAYVFARNQGGADAWGRVAALAASGGAAGDYFGTAVAIGGDMVAVGAPYQGGEAGAVYLFARNQGGADAWGQVARLTALDAASNDYFGTALALDGDVLIVGAPYEGGLAGSAYVFARNPGGGGAWAQVAKLTAPDTGMDSYFGWSVAVSGDTAVVGAPDYGSDVAGAAYVFKRNYGGPDAWGQVVELLASDAAHDDMFGRSVAISGDALVVGANYADSLAGAAYVFARVWGGDDDWIEVKKLASSSSSAEDFFGGSAAGSGSTFVVGAYGKADHTGAAYVFDLAAQDVYLPVIFRR